MSLFPFQPFRDSQSKSCLPWECKPDSIKFIIGFPRLKMYQAKFPLQWIRSTFQPSQREGQGDRQATESRLGSRVKRRT